MTEIDNLTNAELKKSYIELESLNKDLRMRLVAIKILVNNINPICAEKLKQVLTTHVDCIKE